VTFKSTLSPFKTTVGISKERIEISTNSLLSPTPITCMGIFQLIKSSTEFFPSVIIPSEIIIAPAKFFSESRIKSNTFQ